MTTFTEWLRAQMRQEHLSCRTLARRSGLTATKIRLATAQDAAPSAFAVRRLARHFGADEVTLLRLAAEQCFAPLAASFDLFDDVDLQREFMFALYIMSGVQHRIFNHELEARVAACRAQSQAAPG